MRKNLRLIAIGLILIGVGLIFTPWKAHGAPFLTADPYVQQSDPNLNPVSFVITGIGTAPITSNAYIQPSTGNILLLYDLANLANGTYTVTAASVNVFGGTSIASAPFTFTKGTPGTPSNLRIVPTQPL